MNLIDNTIKYSKALIIFFSYIYIHIKVIYIIKNKIKIDIIKEIITFIFYVYNILLFYIVTVPEYNYNIINFELFKEIKRYPIGSKLFLKNVIGNIVVFIPYGLYISYYLEIKKFYYILISGLFFSLVIEIMQISVGRVFDVDDIILNTFGCLIGYLFYRFLLKD